MPTRAATRPPCPPRERIRRAASARGRAGRRPRADDRGAPGERRFLDRPIRPRPADRRPRIRHSTAARITTFSVATEPKYAVGLTVPSLSGGIGIGVTRHCSNRMSAFGEQTGKHLLVLRLTGFDSERALAIRRLQPVSSGRRGSAISYQASPRRLCTSVDRRYHCLRRTQKRAMS
jgi:hypothetical protein